MSHKFSAMGAGVLAMVLAAAPISALHSQVVAPGTNPTRTDTVGRGTPTDQTPTPTTPSNSNGSTQAAIQGEINTDLPFIREAASANMMEVTLGRLAESKASNSSVKSFGERMVTDHNRLQNQLTGMLSQNGIAFNTAINSEHQQQVTRLRGLSGSEFDREYMSLMIQDHQTDISKFQDQSRSANSAQVRSLASRALPVLQEHLRMAQSVGAQVNATNVATSGGNAGNMSASDRAAVKKDLKFIRENTADNYLEVSLGRLAMERAQSSEVKGYAEKIIKDHNALQDQWVAVAQQAGVGFKTGIGKNHRAKLNQLEKLRGAAFDRAFMTQLIRDHKDYLDYLEKEGRASHSSQVRNLVEKSIPVLRDHFEEGKRIGAQVGANTNVMLRSEK